MLYNVITQIQLLAIKIEAWKSQKKGELYRRLGIYLVGKLRDFAWVILGFRKLVEIASLEKVVIQNLKDYMCCDYTLPTSIQRSSIKINTCFCIFSN